jgi:hypothetical protein
LIVEAFLWTAQREGDLLALSWASYDGTHIRLKQSKTGARMIIPVGVPSQRSTQCQFTRADSYRGLRGMGTRDQL